MKMQVIFLQFILLKFFYLPTLLNSMSTDFQTLKRSEAETTLQTHFVKPALASYQCQVRHLQEKKITGQHIS